MQRSTGVIELSSYREIEASDAGDVGQHFLPAGTQLLLGQYTITGYLNCGGFGITYVANDSLGRTVVIKECFPSEMCHRSGKALYARTPKYKDELASIIRHFVGEAHRLARIDHHNIVRVHQIFEENQTAYIAMDFVDGPDLLDIIADDPRRFSPQDVVAITRKLLEAVRYIHDRGMLHRDISPDNILIGSDNEPVLIDFGAAREHAKKSRKALSKLKFVKDGYSPQEFYLAGSDQGTWSDLYSLAASIYHLISGNAPVDGQTRIGALAAKKPDPYVPLAGSVSGYSARFLHALDKAMAVLPKDRIQTADEWLSMLSHRVASAKSRPIAAAVDRFGQARVSGSVLRVAAEKRAFAVMVIVAGLSIVGLAALPFIGVADRADAVSAVSEVANDDALPTFSEAPSASRELFSVMNAEGLTFSTPSTEVAALRSSPSSVSMPARSPSPATLPEISVPAATPSLVTSSVSMTAPGTPGIGPELTPIDGAPGGQSLSVLESNSPR